MKAKLENGEELTPEEEAVIGNARTRILANFAAQNITYAPQKIEILDQNVEAAERNVDRIKAALLDKNKELAAHLVECFFHGDATLEETQDQLTSILHGVEKIR